MIRQVSIHTLTLLLTHSPTYLDNKNLAAQAALTDNLVNQFQDTDPNFDVFYKTEVLVNEKKSIASKVSSHFFT